MAAEKALVMTRKRTAGFFLLSLLLIFIGITLRHMPSGNAPITGMAALGVLADSDAKYAVVGILIAAMLSFFIIYIAENKKI